MEEETWYAIYETATGNLYSMGTIVGIIRDGLWIVRAVDENKNPINPQHDDATHSFVWNAKKKFFVWTKKVNTD